MCPIEASAALSFAAVAWVIHALLGVALPLLLTHAQRSDRFARYRIAPLDKLDAALVRKGSRSLVLGHALGFGPLFALLYVPLAWRGVSCDPSTPTAMASIGYLIGYWLIQETGFYWFHRTMHRPFWYRRVHRVHHEFRTTSAVATEYFHPAESVALSLLVLSGPLLLGGHLALVYVWLAVAFLETADSHCGFAFPWSVASKRHAAHHWTGNGWYGAFFNLWDRALGTTPGARR
jgi:sterol desaturase/sphingolipid hydroxylase (fatty acid hydroxylase superfamily)